MFVGLALQLNYLKSILSLDIKKNTESERANNDNIRQKQEWNKGIKNCLAEIKKLVI